MPSSCPRPPLISALPLLALCAIALELLCAEAPRPLSPTPVAERKHLLPPAAFYAVAPPILLPSLDAPRVFVAVTLAHAALKPTTRTLDRSLSMSIEKCSGESEGLLLQPPELPGETADWCSIAFERCCGIQMPELQRAPQSGDIGRRCRDFAPRMPRIHEMMRIESGNGTYPQQVLSSHTIQLESTRTMQTKATLYLASPPLNIEVDKKYGVLHDAVFNDDKECSTFTSKHFHASSCSSTPTLHLIQADFVHTSVLCAFHLIGLYRPPKTLRMSRQVRRLPVRVRGSSS